MEVVVAMGGGVEEKLVTTPQASAGLVLASHIDETLSTALTQKPFHMQIPHVVFGVCFSLSLSLTLFRR